MNDQYMNRFSCQKLDNPPGFKTEIHNTHLKNNSYVPLASTKVYTILATITEPEAPPWKCSQEIRTS